MSDPGPVRTGGADEAELDVTVVLPVYNEKGHLPNEIDRIRAARDGAHGQP